MAEIAASPEAMRASAAAWARARGQDDRLGEADPVRLAIWAESVDRWKLGTDDLIEGVTRHYESGTLRPTIGVGDLIHHAREARRQRAEREKATEIHDAAALPAGSGWAGLPINAQGRPVWAAYDTNDAIERQCPHCSALPGDACISKTQQPQRIPCLSRMKVGPS